VNPLFLLDTNTCIEYLRKRNQNVINQIHARPPNELRLCSIVTAELYFGACKSPQQAANFALLATFLPVFLSLPFDDRAAREYGQIRADLEAKGTPIGSNDLMIAAIALANDLTLVTHNTSEFSRVPGLRYVDWQIP
jgi:tRNA(fMet)-specific endonuclease VapC